jgi:hypothetical protein
VIETLAFAQVRINAWDGGLAAGGWVVRSGKAQPYRTAGAVGAGRAGGWGPVRRSLTARRAP